MEKKVKVQYEFLLKYEHEEHYQYLLNELKKIPVLDMGGAGGALDNNIYSYSCKIVGKGEIINPQPGA